MVYITMTREMLIHFFAWSILAAASPGVCFFPEFERVKFSLFNGYDLTKAYGLGYCFFSILEASKDGRFDDDAID